MKPLIFILLVIVAVYADDQGYHYEPTHIHSLPAFKETHSFVQKPVKTSEHRVSQNTNYYDSSSSTVIRGQDFGIGTSSSSGSASSFGGHRGKTKIKIVDGEPIIKKFYYVYEAPQEEHAEVKERTIVRNPEKHYKIIFVKVPTYGSHSSSYASVGPQFEEKTKIYVLLKEQDAIDDEVNIAKSQIVPSKPEVVFVKYKGNKKIGEVDGVQGISVLQGGHIEEDELNDELVKAGGLRNVLGTDYYSNSGGSSQIGFGAGGGDSVIIPFEGGQYDNTQNGGQDTLRVDDSLTGNLDIAGGRNVQTSVKIPFKSYGVPATSYEN